MVRCATLARGAPIGQKISAKQLKTTDGVDSSCANALFDCDNNVPQK